MLPFFLTPTVRITELLELHCTHTEILKPILVQNHILLHMVLLRGNVALTREYLLS